MRPEDSQVAGCPDDETLAALIERRVSGDRLARLELHVATCSTCLDVVASTLPSAGASPVPAVGHEHLTRDTSPGLPAPSGVPWRRWAMAAAMLFAVGGLLLAALQQPLGRRVAPTLARLGTRVLGIPLAARAVDLRLGDRPSSFVVTLRDVAIGRSSGIRARADEIGITIALAAPLFGEPLITSVRLMRPEVEVPARGPMGMVSSRVERAHLLALLTRATRIEVTDARVVLPGAGGSSLALEGLTGGVQRTAEGASLALRGHAAGGTVDVVGCLEGNTDELLVTLGGRGLDATALPILGERVRGLVDVRVDVSTNAGSLRANGRVAVRQGHVIGSGPTSLLRLSPDARTILAALDPAVAGDDLSFDDARAIFAWRRGAWRFPRIFVSRGPLIAGGRARVDARGAVNGYGTLRLPAELTRALQPYEPQLAAFLDGNGAATLPFAVGGSVRALQLTLGRPWL